MKLREITLTKELARQPRLHDIEKLFKKYNWHFLGRGADASVAEHPNKKYVLKVFQSNSRYRDFVNLARAHENNPHFPKFYGRIKKVPGLEEYSFIRTEKLDRIPNNYVLYSLFLPEMLYLYNQSQRYGLDVVSTYDIRGRVYDRYKIHVSKLDLSNVKIWDTVSKPNTEWMQATDLICAVADREREILLDLHLNNFMTRNGVLVYLDPFM